MLRRWKQALQAFAANTAAWMRPARMTRLWRQATGKQRAVAMVGLVVVLGLAAAPIALQVHASQPRHSSQPPMRLDPRAAAKRFQQLHFGKQQPSAAAYQKALQQATRLPRSPLGGAAGASATHGTVRGTTTPANVPGTWLPLGPQPPRDNVFTSGSIGGDVTAVAVDPSNSKSVWIGTSVGGVWHTSDGGTSWTPMTDTQATMAIGSVAIDPADPNTVYVGTGDANNIFGNDYPGLGLLKTTDGGKTWTLIDTADFEGLAIGRIAVDPTNTQVLLLSAGWDGSFLGDPDKTGIWRSTDGGTTWTQTLNDPGQTYPDAGTDVLFDPADASVAYAGLGNLYALNATTASGVYQSTDNGQTWNQITALPTGSDIERVSLTISPDGTRLYAALTDGDYRDYIIGEPSFGTLYNSSFYTSSDAGATWAPTLGGVDLAQNYWWYASEVSIDPSDSTGKTVYAGSVQPYRSTDGGAGWTILPLAFFQHALTFGSAASSSFYVGTEEGIWSGDQNTAWTGAIEGNFVNRNGTAPNGLAIGRFNTGAIGAVGSKAQLYASSPDWTGVAQYPVGAVAGPAQWSLIDYYSMMSTTGVLVDYTNNATVYDESRGNYVAFDKSLDGGITWTQLSAGNSLSNDTGNYVLPFVMSPTNPSELFEATDRVYRNFVPISPVLDAADPCTTPSDQGCVPLSALAVAPSDDNTIYVGDDAGNIYATTDGGTTWNALTAPCADCFAEVTSIGTDPTKASTVYVTLSDYALAAGQHVFKSTDGGTTWTDISTTLPDAPFISLAVDPANANLILAAGDAGIFASEDAGATWGLLGQGLPNTLIAQVFFSRTGSDIFVATDGRGVWQLAYPHLQTSPSSVALTTSAGVSPSDTTLTIQNTGTGPVNWTLTSSLPSWLSVSSRSGIVTAGFSQSLTLHFSIPASDPPQTYSTTLSFSDPNADDSPLLVPVTVVATPAKGAKTWYFAEGYTGGNATEYLTLANPNPVAANVTVQYLLGSGAPIIKLYPVGANQRSTVIVNTDVGKNQNVSMVVTADQPIVAERPYYVTYTGYIGHVSSGTDVLGATSLAQQFDFANLDTTPNHETWLTILNPNASQMTVTITYFAAAGASSPDGTPPSTVIHHTVPANSRGTVFVNGEAGLAHGVYSALVSLDQPGLVERPLYETHDTVTGYPGAADVVGVAQPLNTWYFAEGYTSPTVNERYVLANPTTAPGAVNATVTFYRGDGSSVAEPVTLNPGQQAVVVANTYLGIGKVDNSAVVTASAPILAERVISQQYVGYAGCCHAVIQAPGLSEVLGAAAPTHMAIFAEGYTGGQVAEYLTIENPSTTDAAHVTVTFLPATGGAPTVMTHTIAAHSRYTLFTNDIMPNQFFAMTVVSDVPIVAERPEEFIYNHFAPGSTDIIGYQPVGS